MKSSAGVKPSIPILLVEDEEAILKLLITILTMKYQDVVIYSAINGKAGLDLFMVHTPDIVITDINMPEMSGLEMAKEIRSIKPETKFIVLTGDSKKLVHQYSVEKAIEFEHYIEKPVVFGALFAAIEQCFVEIAQPI